MGACSEVLCSREFQLEKSLKGTVVYQLIGHTELNITILMKMGIYSGLTFKAKS